MTLPSHLRKKVALLVPRLASDFEGEILAAVRAIGRTLTGEGHDLHALADVIRGDATRGPPSSTPRPRTDWREIVRFCRLYGIGVLSPWEFSFIDSLASMPVHWRNLTPKQAARLADIDDKLRMKRRA